LARLFWYDSVNAHPPSLRCACETFGADRIVFGTDFPYWEYEAMDLAVSYIRDAGLPASDVAAILDGNAQGLFGKLLPTKH